MNWGALSKHEKEKRVLLALGGALILAAVFIFGVLPFLDRLDRREDELAQIEDRFSKMERLATAEDRNARSVAEHGAELRRALKEQLPPAEGPFVWATEQVYGCARSAGVEILSLNERRVALPVWVRDPAKAEPRAVGGEDESARSEAPQASRRFAPYQVQLAAQGAYAEIVACLSALERSSPYLHIASLYVTPSTRADGKLGVTMLIEWPWPAGAVDIPALNETTTEDRA